ncbi:MAG: protein kinase [Sandaracinaceae bacterium]
MDKAPDLRLVTEAGAGQDPLLGEVLDGRYRIEELLGEGGMGVVYRATHVTLNKPLALKVLKRDVSKNPEVMERFRREAQSASAIGSPHIIDISDFGRLADGSTYFVMELLDGPSLTEALDAQAPMPEERIYPIAVQLTEGLGAAHERGIIHRDLKPDNVHLVRQGDRADFVKVLDFGIAKVSTGADKKLTQAGQVFGSPHYMSPEQCTGREVDRRTDVYALGVILYEMACGRVPFDADNLMGVLTKHGYEQPIAPREMPPPTVVSPGLEAVILKCLAKAPEARYQTMGELRADLVALQAGHTPEAVAEAVGGSVPARHGIDPDAVSRLTMQPASPASIPGARRLPSRTLLAALALVLTGGLVALGVVVAPGLGLRTAVEPASDEPAPSSDRQTEASEPSLVVPAEAGTIPSSPTEERRTPSVAPDLPGTPTPIVVSTDPSGAEVSADGAVLGNAPVEVPRPATDEPVEITLRHPGYQERTVRLAHLSAPSVRIVLQPVPARSRARRPPRSGDGASGTRPSGPRRPATPSQMDGSVDPFAAD